MPISQERIRELLDADEPDYRAAAAEVGGDGFDALTILVADPEPAVAARAASLLATIAVDRTHSAAAVPVLTIAAQHADPGTRAAAALGATSAGDAAKDLIAECLGDADAGVRLIAFRGLTPPLDPTVAAAVQTVAAADPAPAVQDLAIGLSARNPDPALATELLASALEFAFARLAELRGLLADVPSFAAGVAVPGFADAGGAVASLLVAANAALDLVPSRIAALDLAGAALQMGIALKAIGDATAAVGGLSLTGLLATRIGWDAVVPRGLAAQLGLPKAVPQLRVADGALEYTLIAPGRSLFAAPVGVRFDQAKVTVRLGTTGQKPDFGIKLALTGLSAGVGGGALAALFAGAAGSFQADAVVGVELGRGVTIGGGTRVVLPARAKEGPIDVREIAVELPAGVPNTVDVGAGLTTELGVVVATVDGAGVHLRIDPAAVRDGVNPVSVAVREPTGIGLLLDTGIVRGGGYLGIRPGGFGGALQLRMGPVEIKAVGLLTLDPEFALVIVMSVEFRPPMDLTFGFTLNAVGGILGIQHSLDSDALRVAMADGALDHILFPADPVAAAPAILSTLERVFPTSPGSIVVGPMLELGWGRPVSFLTAQVGVIVSLPDPRIVLIGRVRVALPTPDVPIVDLRALVYGEITADHLLVLVSLNGSRIAGFAVGGDIGLLLRWGGSPEIAISAGGFHPRYQPPRELAGMTRLNMDLSPPAILSLRAEAYFAVTTNSVQLGSRVEMSADVGVADISGHFAFDALVLFSPSFSFLIDANAGLTVHVFGTTLAGVSLTLHLSGPAPWRAAGSAEVEVLWTSADIDVGPFTWGDNDNPPPTPAEPRKLVHAALHRNPGAWQALSPPDSDRVVRLKTAPPSEVEVTVHPMGLFDVRQHAVPLETIVTRVSANPVPEGQRRVHLGVPLVNNTPVGAVSQVTDSFAPGSYLDLAEDQKLSRPSFEQMPAGARIRPPGEGANFDAARETQSRYETFVCDDDELLGLHLIGTDTLFASTASVALHAGAAARSELRARSRYSAARDPIVLADPAEVTVVSKATVATDGQWQTYTHAAEQHLAADTQLARLGVS
ncbi:HEAT repeat domain-containing protein [Nocardia implantans]|uniref:HEAT repeat domain-containing protein n=1 Tax=Nocardia implantans TaxID=3108168 RepID=A0ABU6AX68_9NOCA|nr:MULTISPECIES: HEAT repeat domain-containing protein [unclassified Nocardia]MBF6193950.1 HEAT repeat domain-containing protein [Nocardia beijingensis]MEA3529311.1 HEAT repeat domain-containing protein [Nocardia sp. CDC192]MEB3511897.1 HEAT repeat domain-containing protein [Nocardia sp. CDC186]